MRCRGGRRSPIDRLGIRSNDEFKWFICLVIRAFGLDAGGSLIPLIYSEHKDGDLKEKLLVSLGEPSYQRSRLDKRA